MFDVIIEVSKGSNLKYEISKETNLLRLDRVLHTSMFYPGNYGYFPNTLAGDGDPLDVLVLTDYINQQHRNRVPSRPCVHELIREISLMNHYLSCDSE